MTKLLSILVLLNLALACGRGFDDEKPNRGPEIQSQEVDTFGINQKYLQLVNEHRIGLGLTPVNYHFIVEEISKSHSKGMALHSRPFGHMGFSLRCRRLKNRLGKHKKCGEIVAMAQNDYKAVFKVWIEHPKHRLEIEDPRYTHTGLGMYKDEDGVRYWTQMFVEL